MKFVKISQLKFHRAQRKMHLTAGDVYPSIPLGSP